MDDVIRAAAFARCRALMTKWGGVIPWSEINAPIRTASGDVWITNKAKGIFKPRQMSRGVLSIKTTIPREGRTRRYDDIASDDGFFEYRFEGTNPNFHTNQRLREAWEHQAPFIYVHGISPTIYSALAPCFIEEWNPASLTARVVVGAAASLSTPQPVSADLRRYSTVEAKVRLHQAAFRQVVLEAYDYRCAITGLPERRLVHAAHILPDRDVRGQPQVQNGIAMSVLHHEAYDLNLIDIDPDGMVHVNQGLLDMHDGPTLQHSLQKIKGTTIRLPADSAERPNRDFLAERFGEFTNAA
jgi:putative restriction endonuclease